MVAYCLGALLGGASLYAACGGVTADDCKIKCQDVDHTCTQKCNDDGCKTKCTTDLDNCTASCEQVSTNPKPDGG
jgi:hypothetical protein